MFKSLVKNQDIRLAFLGCGDITKDHTQYARNADTNIQLSYASRTKEKAESYRNKYKDIHAISIFTNH